MTEPSEELRERAQRITDQINCHLEQEMVDLGVIRDEIIAPALAEKDAELAQVNAILPATFYAGLSVARRVEEMVRTWQNAIEANQRLENDLAERELERDRYKQKYAQYKNVWLERGFPESDAAPDVQKTVVGLNSRNLILEANLAATWKALECLTECAESCINPDFAEAKAHARHVLSSSSPGSAWLATAREVVELAESVAADNCVATRVDMIADALDAAFPELAPRRPGCGQCRPCRARALLARPEVQRLW